MRYRVTLDTAFARPPSSKAEEEIIIAFLEFVTEHLEADGGADADAGGTLSTGEVHMSVVVDAADPRDGFEEGSKLIQRAVEAAGAVVEDWWRERFIVEPEEAPEPLAMVGG